MAAFILLCKCCHARNINNIQGMGGRGVLQKLRLLACCSPIPKVSHAVLVYLFVYLSSLFSSFHLLSDSSFSFVRLPSLWEFDTTYEIFASRHHKIRSHLWKSSWILFLFLVTVGSFSSFSSDCLIRDEQILYRIRLISYTEFSYFNDTNI